MHARSRRARRGFTLIELLVVIGIISVLATLLMGAVFAAKRNARRKAAYAEIQALRTALSTYRHDTGHFPRRAPRDGGPDQLLQDDCVALYAALQNRARADLGGGPNAPYLERKHVGKVVDPSRLAADSMGKDGVTGVVPLSPQEQELLATTAFQVQHAPGSAAPLVFLDTWGNPYHYREWASVASSRKDPLLDSPPQRSGFSQHPNASGPDPVPGPVEDRPRDPYGVDIWSNGPNGVNEYGALGSDDVCSWRSP